MDSAFYCLTSGSNKVLLDRIMRNPDRCKNILSMCPYCGGLVEYGVDPNFGMSFYCCRSEECSYRTGLYVDPNAAATAHIRNYVSRKLFNKYIEKKGGVK